MKYAYLDKAGILHVSSSKETATEYSVNGKVIETEIPAELGYPVHDGAQVIAYGPEEMKLDSASANIDPVPAIAALYRECM